MPGIKSISGKNGNMLFKTFTKNGKQETRAYFLPRIQDKSGHVIGYGHQRKTRLTDNEIRQRKKFAFITRAIAARRQAGDTRSKKELWKEYGEIFDCAEASMRFYVAGRHR